MFKVHGKRIFDDNTQDIAKLMASTNLIKSYVHKLHYVLYTIDSPFPKVCKLNIRDYTYQTGT